MHKISPCLLPLTLLSLLLLSACGGLNRESSFDVDQRELKTYPISAQQNALEPVYYDQVSVLSPIPDYRDQAIGDFAGSKKLWVKKAHYKLEQVNLCEVAQAMARELSYSHYCAAGLKETFIDLDIKASPSELINYLESKSGVKILVNIKDRSVNFFNPAFGKMHLNNS